MALSIVGQGVRWRGGRTATVPVSARSMSDLPRHLDIARPDARIGSDLPAASSLHWRLPMSKSPGQFWDRVWHKTENQAYWKQAAPDVLAMVHSYPPDEYSRVLDLGCGLGRHARHPAGSRETLLLWRLANRWPGSPDAAVVARQGCEATRCGIGCDRGLLGVEIQASHLIWRQRIGKPLCLLEGLDPSLFQ